MSGGHFNYKCFEISDFASMLEQELKKEPEYSKNVMNVVEYALTIIKEAANLAKDIEWLYSGDYGEETFLSSIKEYTKNQSDGIFLIEQLWLDPMENEVGSAFGYNSIGYVASEIEAINLVSDCKMYTSDDCWAIYHPLPKYRYSLIKQVIK